MHNGSVCEEKRKSEYRKGATYKYALLKAKSLPDDIINCLVEEWEKSMGLKVGI